MPTLSNLHLALGLHWYQPYTQKKEVLREIAAESYLPILNSIEKKCLGTVNCDITGSLLEQLSSEAPQVIEKMIKLRNRGKITLVNTAAHHPILPLAPQNYAIRQLEENEESYRKFGLLGKKEKLSGVFPPEMAFSENLAPVFSKLGYSWTVTDDLPFNLANKRPTPCIKLAKAGGITCLLRSRLWSSEMSFNMPRGDDFADKLYREFGKQFDENVYQAYIVLWTDAETFGTHHKNGTEHFLTPLFCAVRKCPITLVSCESLLRLYPEKEKKVPSGSWSSSEIDIKLAPYSLWKHPKNEWHSLWWKLADIILRIDLENPESRELTSKVLYSCQTWWWSLYKNKDLFLWAVPVFRKALEFGTPQERKTGESLISRLSNY